MRRILTVLVLAIVVAGGVTAAAPRTTVATPASHGCDWQHELWSTLEALGGNPDWWQVRELDDPGLLGLVSLETGLVSVSPDTPCKWVADVVRHEWMHVRRWFTGEPFNELVADCGSKILGSTLTPYLDRARESNRMDRPCSHEIRDMALALIERGPIPAGRGSRNRGVAASPTPE